MQNLLGGIIPEKVRGLLYLCDYKKSKLTVINCLMFFEPWDAIQAFANIPNPESQIAYGETKEKFEEELQKLHDNMIDPVWLEQLGHTL